MVEVQARAERELDRVGAVLAELGELFTAAGEEIALVGGTVRDAMVGRMNTDLDLTTSARPETTERLVAGWADAVWDIGRDFGTIGCRKGAVDGGDHDVPLRGLRRRRPASRRSPTATRSRATWAAATSPSTRWRCGCRPASSPTPSAASSTWPTRSSARPGAPEDSFSDDPLRMMRAARFAAQLGFAVAPEVVAAMTAMAERIEIISAERVRDELVKLVCAPYPRRGLALLVETGLAARVLPELPALALERDEHHRHKDVYEHTLTVLEQAVDLEDRLPGGGPDFVARFASLMHDVGKPRTRRFQGDGTVTFHHHDVVGAKMTRKRMKALRFSNDTTDAVCTLVELHLRFHGYGDGEWTDAAVRRYVRDAGDQLDRLHVLTRADCTTRNRRKAERLRRTYDDLEERIARLAEQEELQSIRPDLDGNAIMALLGIGPGREVGEAYRFLLEQRMEHGPMAPEAAEAALRAWWADRA